MWSLSPSLDSWISVTVLRSQYHSQYQFSCSVVSNSLWPHGLQHARPPCPSPTPGACSNSCPSCRWCHPIISSFVLPFYSCLQSFPSSGSFPVSHFFTTSGQSIGVSASASVLPMTIQDWFPLGVQGTLKSLLQHHSSKASILLHSAFFIVQLSNPYMTTGKTITLTRQTFIGIYTYMYKYIKLPGWGHGNPLQYSCLKNCHAQRSLTCYSPYFQRIVHNWVTKHSTAHIYKTMQNGQDSLHIQG